MRSRWRPRRRSRCSASSATRQGWRERGWFSPTFTGAAGGFARRARRRPGGRVRAACRQPPRGRLGARPERPLRDQRPDAGRRGSELAGAVAPSGAGEPHPGCEPVGVRDRARGDERPLRRGPQAHRRDPRLGAGPRAEVAGGRAGAAERIRRIAGRRPGRRRARHADGRAGVPRDRRGMVSLDGRGRPARAVYEQGRYDDAFALLGAIDEPPAPTDREWQIKRTGVPARLLARRGELERAERLAREGVAVAAESEFVVLHADVLLDLAAVLGLAERPEDGLGPPPKPSTSTSARATSPRRQSAGAGRVALPGGGGGLGLAARALERVLELRLQLGVEEAERELVVADQVDELLRLLDLGQVAAGLRPDAVLGRRRRTRRPGRGRRSTGRASSGRCRSGRAPGRARAGGRRPRRSGPTRASAGCRSSADSPRGAGRRTGAGRRGRRSCAPASR